MGEGALDTFDPPLILGQRAADWVTDTVGSWSFVLFQTIVVIVWALLNITHLVRPWDPYPFIFMNLIFSLQAAYTASLVMISQNRQDEMVRRVARHNYALDIKAEEEVRAIIASLESHDRLLCDVHQDLMEIKAECRAMRR